MKQRRLIAKRRVQSGFTGRNPVSGFLMRHRLSVLNNFQAAYRGVNPLSGSLKSRKSFIMAQSCPHRTRNPLCLKPILIWLSSVQQAIYLCASCCPACIRRTPQACCIPMRAFWACRAASLTPRNFWQKWKPTAKSTSNTISATRFGLRLSSAFNICL